MREYFFKLPSWDLGLLPASVGSGILFVFVFLRATSVVLAWVADSKLLPRNNLSLLTETDVIAIELEHEHAERDTEGHKVAAVEFNCQRSR